MNMQMVPSRRRKWRPTNWPRLDLCNFYQCPITIRNNEKSTKGAIFLQKIMHFDFDACRTCFHLLYSRESTRRWGLLQIKHVDRGANVDQENALTRDGQVSPALCAANVGGVIQGSPGKGASQYGNVWNRKWYSETWTIWTELPHLRHLVNPCGPCWSSFFWVRIRESMNPFADSKVHQRHHGGPNHGDVAWLCGYAHWEEVSCEKTFFRNSHTWS